nr:TatD family hydrolase [Bacteroidales bacterium]
LSLSVGEAVFHENRKIAKSIMSIPLDHLFLETDTGAYSIEEIYAEVSRRIGVPVGTLREQILQNFERIKK